MSQRKTPKRDRMPNYLRALLAGGWEVSPGEMVDVEIRHDDWCAHWRGAPCDCEPELTMRRLEPPKRCEVRN